jgi:hypothetical protein
MLHRWAVACAVTLILACVAGPAEAANGRRLLSEVGLWVQIENRGQPVGYWPGELIRSFDQPAVAAEASDQLDRIKALGVNRFTYELRTADASTAADNCATATTFPSCTVCYALGLRWPEPTTAELTNLQAFFDLVATKGMKIDLLLITTHMEVPQAQSKGWLGPIFDTVQGHSALGVVLFGGDANKIDTSGDGVNDACGSQGGEAPLWLGPNSYAGRYLKWVIPFAISRGITAKQLSAESVIGDFFVDSEPPAGPSATGGHLWKPIRVMKMIFDAVAIPTAQRTYAMSFYERRKCSNAQYLTCTPDLNPHEWAENRLQDALSVIAPAESKQMLMTEGGTLGPAYWPAERAYESLGSLMNKYGLPGGNFWRWTNFNSSEDVDPNTAKPVKKRGMAYEFLPPKNEIVDLGGYHLLPIPNGSFETGTAVPSLWTIAGTGTASRYHLAGEAGQPQVPSRGEYNLRLVTASSGDATIRATSRPVAVDPNRTYTTTANLRFNWSGDPNPGGSPATRPHVFITVNHYQASGQASAVRASQTFRYFQENGAPDFRTFPIQYRTPSDAASVRLVIGAAQKNLPSAITLDADNLR